MRVGFDSTMLSLLLHPDARAPDDPQTGKPTDHVEQRLQGLLTKLHKKRGKIIIPTPAVAEVLTLIGPTNGEYLQIINRSRIFEVQPFDEKAAVELAFLNRDVFSIIDGKNKAEPYQKIKIDRQILAICRATRCDRFYTDDKGLIHRAEMCGLPTSRISDVPVPDEARQHEFELEQHDPLPPSEPDDDAQDIDDAADSASGG